MNTTDVPMEPTSSPPCPVENLHIPIIQEVVASNDMEQQDHD